MLKSTTTGKGCRKVVEGGEDDKCVCEVKLGHERLAVNGLGSLDGSFNSYPLPCFLLFRGTDRVSWRLHNSVFLLKRARGGR